MAGLSINLNAFTENASRLGARLSESITEHTRDLAITRGLGSTYFDAPEEKVRNARKQLDSSSDREKLDALKTLIAVCKIYSMSMRDSSLIAVYYIAHLEGPKRL